MTDTLPPASSTPASPEEIAAALTELRTVLERSAGLVRQRDLVDLAGLETEARQLLDAAVALPPEHARLLLPFLEEVLAALEGVQAALTETHGETLGGAEPASRRMRAAVAYRKPEEA